MKKAKGIGFGFLVIVLAIGMFAVYWLLTNWTIRYRTELDEFFGKGNWEVVSEEFDSSRVYAVRNSSSWNAYGEGRPRRWYRNWNVLCNNANGEEEIWKISNHTYKINHERYRMFSSKRYTAHQALMLELMEISFAVAEDEVHREIVGNVRGTCFVSDFV